MLNFMTSDVFAGLIWAVILIGGAFAILRLLRDLSGPPRWPEDEEAPPGGGPPTAGNSSASADADPTEDDPFAPHHRPIDDE